MTATLTTENIDNELRRLTAQRRHAELNGWTETAQAHTHRIDLLLDQRVPQQREGE